MYSSNLSFSNGSSRNKWFVSRIRGGVPQTCEQEKQLKEEHVTAYKYVVLTYNLGNNTCRVHHYSGLHSHIQVGPE